MRPIFTIHGGEYLFANEFEKRYPSLKLWIPAKDVGIDFLITNESNSKALSVQVKYSRDYNILQIDSNIRSNLKSLGWFHLNRDKLKTSKADYWVLLNYEGKTKTTDFFFIKPKNLLKRYNNLGRNGKIIDSYLWVLGKTKHAYETRGLRSNAQTMILSGRNNNRNRNFTIFLDRWNVINKYFNV